MGECGAYPLAPLSQPLCAKKVQTRLPARLPVLAIPTPIVPIYMCLFLVVYNYVPQVYVQSI